ncbi:MAG: hypothetical protein HFG28_15275 [Eubacterium sp.]|nr:hypothetical protein [Eubacterium sp.]
MVIFLDLDGVVNCEADWAHPYTVRMECVKSLSVLVKALKADVVLASSWRTGWVRGGKCTPQIENLKYTFSLHGIEISGRTANLGNRSYEIADYCHRHDVASYLILDDDLSLFTSTERVYNVNAKTGLTNHDVRVIIKKCKKGVW